MKDKRMEKRKRYLLTVLWLAGMLLSVRGLMASDISLLAAMLVGAVVSGARLAAEKNPKTEEYVRRGIYLGSLVCFALTVSMMAQGMLLLVNQVTQLWNHRFGTTLGQFQVGDSAWIGSVLMWGLLAVPLVSFVAAQIRQRKQWGRCLLSTIALATGSVLSGKTMWLGVCVLLLAVVKTFLYYSVPDRKPGRYNVGSTVLALVILAGIFGLTTGGYQRMAALENWKQGVKDGVEEFRYGRDTLPKGNLSKAAGLQHGEEERLQIHMDTPQELYPRGFVGGTYTGTSWEPVDASAYQGEYEGMLQWLETENFSPLSQYDRYEELTRNNQEQSLTRTEVTVKNTGTYRKYMYLPTTVSEWRMQTCLNTAPASLPKGEDYLTWFLTEEQEGNAVAYAAAAVLAYRVAGDPARYVEGYHLAEQEKMMPFLPARVPMHGQRFMYRVRAGFRWKSFRVCIRKPIRIRWWKENRHIR